MRISELSRRVGVSADTLRAWERRYGVLSPRRTVGNTRLYSNVDEARVRVMQRYIGEHVPVAQAAELAKSARLAVRAGDRDRVAAHERERALTELRVALDAFNETAAETTLNRLLGAYAVSAVLSDVVLPYIHDVGERWVDAHLNIAQEHFTTGFMLSRLLALARGWDRGLGPRAVIAAAPDDQHTLGLICFGIALHRLGWRITCLGAATPVSMVHAAAEATDPGVVVVASSMAGNLHPHVPALERLSATWPVALAGAGADAALARACGARHLAQDPIGAATALACA